MDFNFCQIFFSCLWHETFKLTEGDQLSNLIDAVSLRFYVAILLYKTVCVIQLVNRLHARLLNQGCNPFFGLKLRMNMYLLSFNLFIIQILNSTSMYRLANTGGAWQDLDRTVESKNPYLTLNKYLIQQKTGSWSQVKALLFLYLKMFTCATQSKSPFNTGTMTVPANLKLPKLHDRGMQKDRGVDNTSIPRDACSSSVFTN